MITFGCRRRHADAGPLAGQRRVALRSANLPAWQATTSHWQMRANPARSHPQPMTRTPARGETAAPDRFTALPDHQTLDATVVALEEHGFSAKPCSDASPAALR